MPISSRPPAIPLTESRINSITIISYLKNFRTPKTEKSKRTVCVPEKVVETLKEYRAWQLENQKLRFGEYFDEEFIFTQENEAPIHPDNAKRILDEIEANHPEIPHLKCHKFRHSVASFLIYMGHDIATVSKMLGHSNIGTTLNYYTHAMPQGQRELAKYIERSGQKSIKACFLVTMDAKWTLFWKLKNESKNAYVTESTVK